MKRILVPILLLAVACAPKTSLPKVPIRTYNAPQATGPIVIDGILDEPDWQNAPGDDPALFNTIPARILDRDTIGRMKPGTVIFELAPGADGFREELAPVAGGLSGAP